MNRFTPEERLLRCILLGVLVDLQDQWALSEFTWRISTKGYVETTYYAPDGDRFTLKLHHIIMGVPINGFNVDHEDRNKLNNHRDNLRYLPDHASIVNSDRVQGSKHIYYRSRSNRYEVRIRRDDREYFLGAFASFDEACIARENFLATYRHIPDGN